MTCEVGCFNKQGLAIAVDSAVTLGRQGKAYPNAEKLFPLPNGAPVAIATYGNAEFLGVSWGLVFREFAARLGTERFDTVGDYAHAFVEFLESDHPLFTRDQEDAALYAMVWGYWGALLAPVTDRWGEDSTHWGDEAWAAVGEALAADASNWAYGADPRLGAEFGDRVRTECEDVFLRARDQLFSAPPPQPLWEGLLSLGETMCTQAWLYPRFRSGVVFLGFGEAEYFPGYVELELTPRLLGRVKVRTEVERITFENEACIATFGQSEMVHAFLMGASQRALGRLEHLVAEAIPAPPPGCSGAQLAPQQVAGQVLSQFVQWLDGTYFAPLRDAVGALPPAELAKLARTLVSLAAFRSSVAADETGTVGGAIRVATITKHGGVEWVARDRSL